MQAHPWLLEVPYDIRDGAIIEFVKNLKTEIAKVKENPGFRFRMTFKAKTAFFFFGESSLWLNLALNALLLGRFDIFNLGKGRNIYKSESLNQVLAVGFTNFEEFRRD